MTTKSWTLIICGVIALITTGALSFFMRNTDSHTTESREYSSVPVYKASIEEAESFATQYLHHTTVSEALPDTLPDPLISGSMQLFWAPLPPLTQKLKYITQYSLEGGFSAFYFRQLFDDDSTDRKVIVFQSPSGSLYFDWRSYMGIQDIDLSAIHTIKANQPVLVRARVEHDTYYNFGYHENEWQSLKLSNPNYSRVRDAKTTAYLNRDHFEMPERAEGKTILLKVLWTGKVVEVQQVYSSRPVSYTLQNLVIPHFKRQKL